MLARAKINLTLHVGQKRESGYHALNSLVVFADIGDVLTAQQADKFSLGMDGPFEEHLAHENDNDNLVLTAAKHVMNMSGFKKQAAYMLTKNVPVSSGIGGGSADAAAAVHLLQNINGKIDVSLDNILLKIGADVPVCYRAQTCIMEGIGEILTPLPKLGQLNVVLVNPGIGISTAEIFNAFDANVTSSYFPEKGDTLLTMAKTGRNDLQDIAVKIAPVIQDVITLINTQNGCKLARMSGSGATCFGIFGSQLQAHAAVHTIKVKHPAWWCVPTLLGDAT